MERRRNLLILLVLLASAQFFISNFCFRGYLRSPHTLGRELKTPVDALEDYRLVQEPPFKYRLVFPALVKYSHQLLYERGDSDGFYMVYFFWSLAFFLSAAIAFFWLLTVSGFSETLSFLGSLIFLLLPPMLFAYTLPVHTREDTLAYTVFFVALGLLLQKRWFFFFSLSLAAVLVRETLMLLPVLYLFYSGDKSIIRRFIVAGSPAALWLLVRFSAGNEPYDHWLGLRWNLANPEQVIGFSFVTFNVLWLTFFLERSRFRTPSIMLREGIRVFYHSSWLVLVLLAVTTFIGGIFNEIRLLNLYAPWMIIPFLVCIERFGNKLKLLAGTKNYRWYAVTTSVVCGVLLYYVLVNREKFIPPGKYAVPYDQWVIVSVCYIFVTLLFIPHLVTMIALKKSAQ